MPEFSENGFLESLDQFLPDNSTQQISPKDVRDTFTNLVDSAQNFLIPHEIIALNIGSYDYRQTKLGLESLDQTSLSYESGVDNTAIGYYALHNNVYGQRNTGVGSYALSCNLDGDDNVSLGFRSLMGNVEGVGNVAIGNNSLYQTRRGSYNIALGHGAGYYIGENDNYQFYIGAHISSSGVCPEGSGTPLMRGDLNALKLAIGTNEIHDYGMLQVSGDVSPTLSRQFSLGNVNRAWSNINGVILFPDNSVINVTKPIVPTQDSMDLGSSDNRFDGFFNDISVSGKADINDLEYLTITNYLYEAKTLHLATDGLCDGDNLGLGPGAVCGYLTDQGIDGAGFEIHSSGADYRRDYKFVYRFPNVELNCLSSDNAYSRSRWESNISIETTPGNHVMTDRVLGRDNLGLFIEESCYGVLISGENLFFGSINDIDLLQTSGYCNQSGVTMFGATSFIAASGEDELYTRSILGESGVVGHKLLSQDFDCNSSRGFSLRYTDTPGSGDPTFYATSGNFFAIERITPLTSDDTKFDSFVIDMSGNIGTSNSSNFDPLTTFNIYSTGDSVLRVAAEGDNKPSLELLGDGNDRDRGFQIIYHTNCDDSIINYGYYCPVDVQGEDKVVVDFDLIKPSGELGWDLGFMSATEDAFVGIGTTKYDKTRLFTPIAPLTIYHDGCAGLSGTVALKEQALHPNPQDGFGQLYIQPFSTAGDPFEQAVWFADDAGNKKRISLSPYVDSDGLVWSGPPERNNTFAGLHAPDSRPTNGVAVWNTIYGFSAGYSLTDGDSNTLIGEQAGSGISTGSCNTVVGRRSMRYANGDNNVIIGCKNIGENATDDGVINDAILIGNNLKTEEEILDGTIQIGSGDFPIIDGRMGGTQYLDLNVDYLNINDGDLKLTETQGEFGDYTIRNENNELCILFSSGAVVDYEVACFGSGSEMSVWNVNAHRITFEDGSTFESASAEYDIQSETVLPLNSENCDEVYVPVLTVTGGGSPVYTQGRALLTSISELDCFESISGVAGSGGLVVSENCNFFWSNNPDSLDASVNSRSVIIGCDAGLEATGWKNSVMIGSEAGRFATITNPGLSIDTNAVFIGERAGYDADQSQNSVFIGSNAGQGANLASESVFIGINAGLYSQMKNSIGIGDNALRGNNQLSFENAGSGNIEMIAGIEDSDRLLYQREGWNGRLNINNTIAGHTTKKTVSIGDAILDPDAPLSVRRDIVHDDYQWSHTAYSALVDATGHEDDFIPDSGYLYPLYLFSTDAANDPSHVPGSNVIEWGGDTALSGFPTVTFYQPFIDGEVLGESGNLDQGSAGGYEVFSSGLIPKEWIQTWYCRDEFVAGINCDGFILDKDDNVIASPTAIHREGKLIDPDDLPAPVDFCSATSGIFVEYEIDTDGNCNSGDIFYIKNRDTTLTVSSGDYVIVSYINQEWRPVWVSC